MGGTGDAWGEEKVRRVTQVSGAVMHSENELDALVCRGGSLEMGSHRFKVRPVISRVFLQPYLAAQRRGRVGGELH